MSRSAVAEAVFEAIRPALPNEPMAPVLTMLRTESPHERCGHGDEVPTSWT